MDFVKEDIFELKNQVKLTKNINYIFSTYVLGFYQVGLNGTRRINNYQNHKDMQEIIYLDMMCKNVINEFGKFKEYLHENNQKIVNTIENVHEGLEFFLENKKEENILILVQESFSRLTDYIENNLL